MLGGSHSEIRLIEALNRLGVYTIVAGNNGSGLSACICDNYYNVDYSDWRAILKIAREQNASFVVSAANDFAIFSAAKVSATLGLPGYDDVETLKTLHHKHKYKALLDKMNVLTPTLIYSGTVEELLSQWNDLRNELDYQKHYLFKPVDLGSGIGITQLSRDTDINGVIGGLLGQSREKTCIVETYEDGSLHSFSAFIRGKKVIKSFVVDEWLRSTTYLVDRSCYPSRISNHETQNLRHFTERLAERLDLVDGLIHHQFIYNKNGCHIIETTRRLPGDMYGDKITISTRQDYHEDLLSAQFDLSFGSKTPVTNPAIKTFRRVIWSDECWSNSDMVDGLIHSSIDISSQYFGKQDKHRDAVVFFHPCAKEFNSF